MRWTKEQAWAWYNEKPWLIGCNFTPSTAINQLEMWQKETYNPETIKRELSWAKSLGFNTIRVYLHDLIWANDLDGFKTRIDEFLQITSQYDILPVFVFFDDCWNTDPKPGPQLDPKPGVHNSGWVQGPGISKVLDSSTWGPLEDYVKGILERFGNDARILMWDLYNEPGNNKLGEKSLGLLEKTFQWARETEPEQPLSVGVWFDNPVLNKYQIENSDIITFHNYHDAKNLLTQIEALKQHGRPLVCTEYMARTRDSRFQTHLPIFKRHQVGCINWGLVSGKAQTIYPWGSEPGSHEPETWFHDIFRKDGSPYSLDEVEFIREITGA
jgi:Cellulase (glycosyl hydrolase family 5)